MSPSVDNRIVEMQFKNSEFESGIKTSVKSLETLTKSLELKDAGKSFDLLQKASQNVSFAALANSVDAISKRFTTLGIMGVTALQNITNSAIEAGKSFIKSVSIDQVTAGFSKYEEKIRSVQTIMNATGKSVGEVNGYLDQLMWFSDETSYGFNDMTSALATMTSSGGKIETLIPLVTGLASAVAYAGKGANDYALAMRNVAQSYSKGYLQGLDWQSLVTAGVGSEALKQLIIDEAVAQKTIKKGQVTTGTFQDMLSKKKFVTRSVMEKSLGEVAAFSDAVYKAMQNKEYSSTADAIEGLKDGFSDLAVKAFKAAQTAKTFTETIYATRDAVSTGWMKSFEIIFGNIEEASALWSGVTANLWEIFAGGAEARNDMFKEWKALGGRDEAIQVYINLLNTFKLISGEIGKVFKEIFPPMTAEKLMGITQGFQKFTLSIHDWLLGINGGDLRITQIGKIFKGIFAIFDIGWKIISGIGKAIWSVFKPLLGTGIDGLLTFFADIGDSIAKFAAGLETNATFVAFFKGFGDVLAWFVAQAPGWWAAIVGFFSSDTFNTWKKSIEDFFAPAITTITGFIQQIKTTFLGLFGITETSDGIWGDSKKTVMQQIQEKLGTPEGIQSVIDNVKTLFATWGAAIKVEFDKVKLYFKPLTDWIGKYVDIIKTFFTDLFAGTGTEGGVSFWDQFKALFGSSKDIKELFDGVVTLVSKVWADLKQKIIDIFTGKKKGGIIGQKASAGILTDFGFKGGEDKKGGFFAGLFAFLGEIWGWLKGNWGWLVGGAIIVGAIAVLRIVKTWSRIGELLAGKGKYHGEGIGNSFLKMAGAVTLIVGAIYAVTLMAKDANFVTALWVVGGIIAVLGGLTILNNVFGKMPKGTSVNSMGTSMLAMAGSVVLIIFAIKQIQEMLGSLKEGETIWSKFGPALLAVGAILLALVVVNKIGSGKGINGNWKSILAIAASVWILVKALKPIADMSTTQLEQMGKALGGLTIAIGSLMLISRLGGGTGKISGIIGLAIGIWAIIETLKPLLDYDKTKLQKLGEIGFAITLMLSIFLLSIRGMKAKAGISALGALLGLAGFVWALSIALDKIKSVDDKKIKAFTVGLTALMVGFGYFLKASKKAGLKGLGIALLSIIGLVAVITLVVAAFSELSKNQKTKDFLNNGAEFLGELVGTFTGAMRAAELKSFSKGLEGFKDLTVDKASIQKAIDAGDLLADFSASLPDKNIFQQIVDWLGGSKLAIFSRDIGLFGEGFSSFAVSMSKINFLNMFGLQIKTTAAISVAKAISRFEEGLPPVSTTTRIISWLAGKSMSDLALFSSDMAGFGTSFNAFATAMAGVLTTTEEAGLLGTKTDSAILIAASISKFAKDLKPESGITKLTSWLGSTTTTELGLFSKDMPNFGVGFNGFATAMAGVLTTTGEADLLEEKTKNAIKIAQALITFETGIPEKSAVTKALSAWIAYSTGTTVTELGLLSKDMPNFGVGFNGFATAMAGVLTTPEEAGLLEEKTKNAIKIAQALITFETGIPEKSAVTKALSAWIAYSTGTTVTELGLLSKDMPNFGIGFNAYATAMAGVLTTTSEAGLLASKTDSAILIADSIAKWAGTLPPVTGDNAIPILVWGSAIEFNAKDMAATAKGFNAFANGVLKFENPSGWEAKAKAAIAIAKSVAEFSNILPPVTGDTTIPILVWGSAIKLNADDMAALGTGFNAFATGVFKIDDPPTGWEAKATTAIAIAKSITEFSKILPPVTGDLAIPIIAWGSAIEQNSKEMEKFASGFNTFATEMMKLTIPEGFQAQVDAALLATRKVRNFLLALNANATTWGTNINQFDAISFRMKDLGTTISAFNIKSADTDVGRFTLALNSITGFANAISALSTTVTTDSVAKLSKLIVDMSDLLSKDLVTNVATGIQNGTIGVTDAIGVLVKTSRDAISTESNYVLFINAAANLIGKFANGITSEPVTLKVGTAIEQVITNCVLGFTAGWDRFKDKGSYLASAFSLGIQSGLTAITTAAFYLVQGLASGIDKYAYLAEAAALKLGASLPEKINEGTKSDSPSELGIQAGKNVVDGVTTGLYTYKDQAIAAAKDVGTEVSTTMADTLKKGMAKSKKWAGANTETDFDYKDAAKTIITDTVTSTSNKLANIAQLAGDLFAGKSVADTLADALAAQVASYTEGEAVLADYTAVLNGNMSDDALKAALGTTGGYKYKKPGTTGDGSNTSKAIAAKINSFETVGKGLSQIGGTSDFGILANKLDELGRTISNMKIVMDSGALVGQIRPKMDQQLGVAAVYAGRG